MNESGRVEAFSDGVFAIAITLLILEIKVPAGAGDHLWRALGAQWPSYFAYVVSFLVIGIVWVNHHTLFTFIVRVDRTLLFLNLLVLLIISALPFPTALLAQYLEAPHGSHVAAAVYSAFMSAHALTICAVWMHLTKTGHLFHSAVDAVAARRTRRRYALGLVVYPITIGLAFVSAPLTLAVHGLLAVYYAFNQVPVPVREPA